MTDPFNRPPTQDSNSKQEQLDVRVEIAKPEDWEAYKEIRLMAITGNDAEMFGVTSDPSRVKEEQSRGDIEWKKNLSSTDMFIVLSWINTQVVGMGLARKREEKQDWYMGHGYVKENFRGMEAGKKMFAKRLDEIRKRGGTRVTIGVKAYNNTSIHIAESFCFTKVDDGVSLIGLYMVLEDLNDPKVITRISEVLNAG